MTEDDHNALARDLSIAMLDALPLEDMDANDVAAVVAKAGLGVLLPRYQSYATPILNKNYTALDIAL